MDEDVVDVLIIGAGAEDPNTKSWADVRNADKQAAYLLEVGYYTDPYNADSDGDNPGDYRRRHDPVLRKIKRN